MSNDISDDWYSNFRSSNVSGFRYDIDNQRLFVEFHDGSGYYEGVDEDTVRAFIRASSKGTFVHRYLKDRFTWNRG